MLKIRVLASYSLSAFFLILLLNGCDIGGDKKKVGYIDMKVVLARSGLAGQERIYLEQVEKLLEDTDNKAKDFYSTMGNMKVNVHREADQLMLYEQFKLARQSARNMTIQEAIRAAKKVSVNKGLQFKHYGSLVLISEEYVDITEQVVEELKGTMVNFGSLPRLFIKFPGNIGESQPTAAGIISIK
ncbi:hypothetical protein [Enterobacter ludwigii]|uniref:hypothetical protein n=1 Tax=Enterobacter ludwigii TaxID=299767 RepID=UPI003F710305